MSYMGLTLQVDQLYRELLRGYLSSSKTITVLQKIMTINGHFPIIARRLRAKIVLFRIQA